MVSLDSLPYDVLLHIVEAVDEIRDLAALSIQCTYLYQITDMPTRRRFYRIRINPCYTLKQLDGILLKILKKPILGSYVRQLEVNSDLSVRYYPQENMNRQDNTLAFAVMKAAGLCDSDNEKEKEDILSREIICGKILCLLLFAVCPNIRSLRISDQLHPDIEGFLAKTNARKSALGYLQNLREVQVLVNETLGPEYYNHICFMRTMKLFHRLPSIQTMRVGGMFSDDTKLSKLAPSKSNISRIIIEKSNMDFKTLEKIIKHPKALEVFRYSIGGRFMFDTYDAYPFPKKLGRALQHHKSTLRVLDIDVDTEIYWLPPKRDDPAEVQSDYGHNDESGEEREEEEEEDSDFDGDTEALQDTIIPPRKFGSTIGSLHDFHALTHLRIGIKLIAGPSRDQGEEYPKSPFRLIDSLPPGLEFLCIRGYRPGEDGYHTSVVSEFMEQRAERFPRLREVQGILEYIPSADLEVPRQNPEPLWTVPDIFILGRDAP
jgi:hypothetical protein